MCRIYFSTFYLGNGWTDCTEILYVVRDQLARQLTQTKNGVHLHVPLFRIYSLLLVHRPKGVLLVLYSFSTDEVENDLNAKIKR